MKRFILVSILITLTLCSFGQRGKVRYLDADTVKGAETIYINFGTQSGDYQTMVFTAYFDEVGGTSDGYAYMQAAIDTSWHTITTANNWLVNCFPTDSLVITDGSLFECIVVGAPYNEYRFVIEGTTGDTTKVTPSILKK